MASYNAGRSLSSLLTDGAFNALRTDAQGYVTVQQAAEQLIAGRARRQQAGQRAEGEEDADSRDMRAFVERAVAAFSRSRPGCLNRREFARLYDTFLKRPGQFAQIISGGEVGAGAADAGQGEEGKGEEEGEQAKETLCQAPQMSRDELRSLVDTVNQRLAEEKAEGGHGSGKGSTPSSTTVPSDASGASGNAGGFILLGSSPTAPPQPSAAAKALKEADPQLD